MFPRDSNENYTLTRKIPMRLPRDFKLNEIEEPVAKAPLNSLNEQVSKLREDNLKRYPVRSIKVRFFTAQPNFSRLYVGEHKNSDWVRLDDGITIRQLVEIFEENLVNCGVKYEGQQIKPIFIKYCVFFPEDD